MIYSSPLPVSIEDLAGLHIRAVIGLLVQCSREVVSIQVQNTGSPTTLDYNIDLRVDLPTVLPNPSSQRSYGIVVRIEFYSIVVLIEFNSIIDPDESFFVVHVVPPHGMMMRIPQSG